MGCRISGRRGRVALAGVAIGVAVLTAGCAAGQIAQTAEEVPGVPGAQGTVGPIQVHNVTLAYPQGGVYQVGSTARLQFVIVNTGQQADQLVGVSSGSATGVRLAPSAPSGPTAQPGQSTASASPSGKLASGPITVGPQANVNVYGSGASVVLTGIVRELRSSQQSTITFRFAKAGTLTIAVPVAPAASELPKETSTASE